MKRTVFLLLLLFYSTFLFAQTTSFTVSMSGISEIKVGMTKMALEKLLNQTIKLPPATKENSYSRDSANCNYNGLNFSIVFEKQEVNNKSELVVWEVKSSHPQLKTRSGIGIGDDKLKVISTYDG